MRTAGDLADGREIIFYDDNDAIVSGGSERTFYDSRPLEARQLPPHDKANIRRDPLTGDPVVIAAHRQNRTFMPPADQDPLAPTVPGKHPTEVPAPDYDVVVFENRFPSLQGPTEVLTDTPLRQSTTPGGRCEVVCFTSESEGSFAGLSPRRARTVIEAWADRTAELGARSDVMQVVPFENRGAEIGVTLAHPHGQIYAYSALPPYTERLQLQATSWLKQHGTDLLQSVLETELADAVRVVFQTDYWVAFVPYAAKWPVEVQLMPKHRAASFTELSDASRADLAVVYPRLLRALDHYFEMPMPYIAAWHQAPVHIATDISTMFLDIFTLRRSPDKMKFLAGSESAMGAWISDTTPELVAAKLRNLYAEEQ